MSKFLEIVILATVAIKGEPTKNERDELLRIHNEIRQSIMNCEYEELPPLKGHLPRLTWNYTLENMVNIHARHARSEYFSRRLIHEFILNQSTFVYEGVDKFEK
ncbi:hypothetical protein EG68_11264 [Paragonimus skrjabini miyazakii]|uniref:SCP domain-containing protein n=1 Tax=Paragonimus skrjabini miyazakii TaxID=59628 RepID=A0A8S9YDM0_9TREM|nr:hypothetical protein EG68_11264 [Paragonimus skrjabini miyazakii]